MNARKALDMLDSNCIEELRKALQDEIYEENIKRTPGAKSRYTAMKRYFGYHKSARKCLQKPCQVEFEDKKYTSFCNSWTLVLTTENTGEIELYDESDGNYPEVTSLLRFDGIKKKIDFRKVIAEAKAKGYRLTNGEVNHKFKYLMLYDGTYYKLGLIDITYRIIDNGEVAMTYHPDGERMPLTIQNELGFCMIMPVRFEMDPEEDDKIVIEVE